MTDPLSIGPGITAVIQISATVLALSCEYVDLVEDV